MKKEELTVPYARDNERAWLAQKMGWDADYKDHNIREKELARSDVLNPYDNNLEQKKWEEAYALEVY